MKIYPLWSSNHAMEFMVKESKRSVITWLHNNIQSDGDGLDWIPCEYGYGGMRFTIYGPAFEALVEKAGPIRQVLLGIHEGVKHFEDVPDDVEPGKRFRAKRPRTCAELCEWLERELEAR